MSTKKICSRIFNSRKICITLCSLAAVLIIGLICGAWIVYEEKEISLVVNGNEVTVKTYARNVSDFLEEQDIVIDKIADSSVDLDSALHDGQDITVSVIADYKVNVDGEVLEITAPAQNVGDVLEHANISLAENDLVEPSLDSPAGDGLVIDVHRVIIKNEVRETELAYSVETKKDSTIVSGDSIVLQNGRTGLRSDTYRVTYYDGEVYSEELVDTEIEEPVAKIVAVGVGISAPKEQEEENIEKPQKQSEDEKSTASDQIAPNGMAASKVITMKATAYHEEPGSLTKSGTLSRVGAVAVDPNVIPLGTKLYVEGYGYCVAEDTGGLIKGNRVDVFLGSDAECREWGVKYVSVYVLE